MKTSKPILSGLWSALGVAVYVTGVALIMQNGNRIFGQMNNFFGPIAFLMLFVLSAAITGTLVLGRPVMLFLENQKPAALKLFGFTLGWLFILTLLVFVVQIFR